MSSAAGAGVGVDVDVEVHPAPHRESSLLLHDPTVSV